jgi:glycosyltransferase involved in cell wall biosynthesis
MRIVTITAGTGSFHCGTCMRDNALVLELRRRGHDALLAPMYLPMVLDEPSAAAGAPLFYGGINVYLQQISGFFRRTPRWLDRLLDAPGMLRMAAKRAGSTRASELGELTISTFKGEDGRQAKELDRLVEWMRDLRPEVVCLSNALLVGMAREIKRRTGAAVVCTLQGEDTFLDALPPRDSAACWDLLHERAADVDAFIAVSRYHGELMTRRARLRPETVHVVHNGIDLEGYGPRPARAPGAPPVLGYLARMYAPKGLGTLVEAFIQLKRRGEWPNLRLHVGGSCTPADEAYVAELRGQLAAAGVGDSVEFHPNLSRSEKIRFLQGLDVFSVPAGYGESFGLYVIEAMAAGTPVVQPEHAAFPETVAATGGGILCRPDDAESLADGIAALLADPARARAMGAAGRAAVHEKFSVQEMARQAERVFQGVMEREPAAVPR